jgi:DNA repair protein RecN (Recombination protein N)
MLTHLQVSNFTLVENLDLELEGGLSAITGETGAGKSILLDALALVRGERADADKVRQGEDKADIQASFDVSKLPFVQKWLKQHELGNEECILRRVVTAEGRSRGFINGQSVTLQQLKALGDMLVDIHGQHEHQSLLRSSTHLRLLDEFGQLRPLAKEVKREFYHWHSAKEKLDYLVNQHDEANARHQLLSYQVKELDELNLEEGELDQLEQEQKLLANLENYQSTCQHLLALCENDEDGLSMRLHTALKMIAELPEQSGTIGNARSLFEQALINIEEAQADIERQVGSDDLDPGRLPEIEQRLSQIYDTARKHRVAPEQLIEHHAKLSDELAGLEGADAQIETLQAEISAKEQSWNELAQSLSGKRAIAAQKLSKRINSKLKDLAITHANFQVALEANNTQPCAQGRESVQFLIATAPGQPARPLAKVASGGELSRISLAIQVVTAQTSTIPTLIFDEVDVGIGGPTGDVVGRLLRELGEAGQVICVTHLAQVASKAHQHLRVEKSLKAKRVNSRIDTLNEEDKILEIARMMGGATDSAQSLAHAKEMLEMV